MANFLRGEGVLSHGEDNYTLVLDMNAFTEAGAELDMGIVTLMNELDRKDGDIKLHVLRAIVFGALRRHHPEMTATDAGDLIQDCGLPKIMGVISDIVKQVLPKAKPASAEGNAEAPPAPNRAQRRASAKTSGGGKPKA